MGTGRRKTAQYIALIYSIAALTRMRSASRIRMPKPLRASQWPAGRQGRRTAGRSATAQGSLEQAVWIAPQPGSRPQRARGFRYSDRQRSHGPRRTRAASAWKPFSLPP